MPPSRRIGFLRSAQAGLANGHLQPHQKSRRLYSSLCARSRILSSANASQEFGLTSLRTLRSPRPLSTFQARLQSTSSSYPAPDTSQPPPETFPSDSLGILSDVRQPTYSNDYIGFLKEDYGIDFGWGTSSILKTLFETVHVYSGTTLGVSIILTALVVRLTMIPITAATVDNAARMQAMKPLTQPLMEQNREAAADRDKVKQQRLRVQLQEINKEAGVKYWKMALPFIQLPLGFGCWRTFRNMADVPVLGMQDAGFAWFTDLTIASPMWGLPAATALLQHLSIRWSQENQAAPDTPTQNTMQNVLKYVLPSVTLIFISWAPAAVQLHFLVTSFVAFITNIIFRTAVIRSMLNVAQMPKNSSPESKSPYKGTITVSGSSSNSSSKSTPTNTRTTSTSKPGLLAKATGGIAGLYTSTRNTIDKMLPKAKSERHQMRTKAEKTKARDYEAKRRRQIEEERVENEREQTPNDRMRTRRQR